MLIKPIITEKSMRDAATGRYTFWVGMTDNKTVIGHEVAKVFGVEVVRVATSIRSGKTKRAGKKRVAVTRPDWKIAVVTIKKGQKIGLFEEEQPKTEEKPKEKPKVEKTVEKPVKKTKTKKEAKA
jgi:large subunit ribosomal protein L23